MTRTGPLQECAVLWRVNSSPFTMRKSENNNGKTSEFCRCVITGGLDPKAFVALNSIATYNRLDFFSLCGRISVKGGGS